jgi:hypothetical protein
LRTRNTMRLVYGLLLSGRRFCHPGAKSAGFLAIASIS